MLSELYKLLKKIDDSLNIFYYLASNKNSIYMLLLKIFKLFRKSF